jgi:hypothetical protein
MMCSNPVMNWLRTIIDGLAAGFFFITITACSSDQPKPMTQPTPDQVRGHADRGFDKLKQEEQEHGTPSQMPR